MKLLMTVPAVLLMLRVAAASAGGTGETPVVVPLKNDTPVFTDGLHRGNEKPAFRVGVNDRLEVVAESRSRYRIKTGTGKNGWVDKKSTERVKPSKKFIFDNADVQGYIDNPSPVYIIDADDPDLASLNLDRSFADALRENADKYTVERETGEESHLFKF